MALHPDMKAGTFTLCWNKRDRPFAQAELLECKLLAWGVALPGLILMSSEPTGPHGERMQAYVLSMPGLGMVGWDGRVLWLPIDKPSPAGLVACTWLEMDQMIGEAEEQLKIDYEKFAAVALPVNFTDASAEDSPT